MNHTSNIKITDLIVGQAASQLSLKFFQVIYICFALYFGYMAVIAKVEAVNGGVIYAFLRASGIYYFLILIFITIWGAGFAVCTPLLKKGVLGEHRFIFEKEGFTEETEYNRTFHSYKGVTKIFETMGAVYIQISAMHWHILPYRDFTSETEKDSLISFVREKVA